MVSYFQYFLTYGVLSSLLLSPNAQQKVTPQDSAYTIRSIVSDHLDKGRINDLLSYLESVEKLYGNLLVDADLPSLYGYRGVALHNSQRLEEAAEAFAESLLFFPNDTRSLLNLGEARTQLFRLDLAIEAFEKAEVLGEQTALSRLLRAKGWSSSWYDFERIASIVEKKALACVTNIDACEGDSSGGLEYTDCPGSVQRQINAKSPNAKPSPFTVDLNNIAGPWTRLQNKKTIKNDKIDKIEMTGKTEKVENKMGNGLGKGIDDVETIGSPLINQMKIQGKGKQGIKGNHGMKTIPTSRKERTHTANMKNNKSNENIVEVPLGIPVEVPADEPRRRLKVGLISSDFGVHPVATLIRGMVQFIDREYVELYCFAVNDAVSWWGKNITGATEHFIGLQGLNTQDAAARIAAQGIEILIDLNGHTMNSGLPLMAHRPVPIQISFLGLPTTTGAPFIDYYIADWVAVPAEHSSHFTEKLLLLPPSYIVNDYAQLQGDVIHHNSVSQYRAPRHVIDNYYQNQEKNQEKTGGKLVKQGAMKQKTGKLLNPAQILFGTLSNSQKVDPTIFQVWMNLLRRFSGARMTFMEYRGYEFSVPNILNYTRFHGVSPIGLYHPLRKLGWIIYIRRLL